MGRASCFVMADTFQYSRQSFQNRTLVRNSQGAQWVTVPLKGGQHGMPHCGTRIRPIAAWRKRHWKAFAFNYRRTPFFEHYEAVMAAFFAAEYTHLADITCASIRLTHRLFGMESRLVRASELPGNPRTLQGVQESFPEKVVLLPRSTLHVDRPRAGRAQVLHCVPPTYRQAFEGFVPGVTALDLLFNYGPDSLAMLMRGVEVKPL